ncbi:hypothetical protein [Glycocaulis sp.]|uniref:hypothetical protein n=1 Tax=Glycocaulis sp. TaxID=1969725 RepID=UPI003F7179BD
MGGRREPGYQHVMKLGGNRAGWQMAVMLALVCVVPPALTLAPPRSGTMLAIFAPGTPPAEILMAASSAGALAAEPLGAGSLLRAEMPGHAGGQSGAAALRAHGAILVIAPISGWACPPGVLTSMESGQ